MKTLICLIRHGETDWNKAKLIQGRFNIPLNEKGSNQIKETAQRLKTLKINWDIYLSSPLDRAVTSCAIIKKELTGNTEQIITRPQLIEREFGKADGTTISFEVYEKIIANEIDGMESTSTIQTRAKQEIQDIVKQYEGKKILIVSHSHFIKALFTTIDPTITFLSNLSNGGISFIEFEDGKIIKYKFNY